LTFISEHRYRWPITVMCRVLDVSSQAFYQFVGRLASQRDPKQAAVMVHASYTHKRTRIKHLTIDPAKLVAGDTLP
jgi:hypothetical protein